MLMNKYRFSWIETLVILAMCLIAVRFIWARELLEFENNVIRSMGLSPSAKYFFIIPVFLLILYFQYRRDARELAGTGKTVVRKSAFIFAGLSLLFVFLYLELLVGGTQA